MTDKPTNKIEAFVGKGNYHKKFNRYWAKRKALNLPSIEVRPRKKYSTVTIDLFPTNYDFKEEVVPKILALFREHTTPGKKACYTFGKIMGHTNNCLNEKVDDLVEKLGDLYSDKNNLTLVGPFQWD